MERHSVPTHLIFQCQLSVPRPKSQGQNGCIQVYIRRILDRGAFTLIAPLVVPTSTSTYNVGKRTERYCTEQLPARPRWNNSSGLQRVPGRRTKRAYVDHSVQN